MSAFLVSKATIDCLVSFAVSNHIGWDGTQLPPDAIGRLLWNENRKSLRARYDKADTKDYWGDEFGRLDYYHMCARVSDSPWLVLKQADCYGYQSCEHDGWKASAAKAFTDEVTKAALRKIGLPEDTPYSVYNERPEYDREKWDLD